jgi:DNA-binding NtrC family response regulator
MEEPVHRVVDKLARATSLEEAAEAVLGAALDVVDRTIVDSRFAGSARVLRAMIHLRSDDGYVRLIRLDAERRDACVIGDVDDLHSATAWRWIKKHDASVAVDVLLGHLSLIGGGAPISTGPPQLFDADGSRIKLQSRAVTHLLAVPLRAPGRRIDGMLAIEADCQQAMGAPFVWPACGPALATLAALGTPYFEQLPVTRIQPTSPDELLPVIGAAMQKVIEMLRIFSRQEETILLGGPTGAGKSRLARWCHAQSLARERVFETLDLAAVPEELQMAELFGWKKGAFTSAGQTTPGAIARAENGTLFIDEVDKLSLKAQAGLLRVLEEKRYRPLGEGAGERVASVRFIVGTNADLLRLCQSGAFRSDLYYRINVLPVKIPPLHGRRDEIVAWATFMLRRRHGASGAHSEVVLAPAAAARLTAHDWPGNLRQLDNIVRRAYALSLGEHEVPPEPAVLRLEHVERALLHEGGDASGGAAPSLLAHLERLAEAFVDDAERRKAQGKPSLDLDLTDALKGFVLEAAKRRGGPDEREAIRSAFVLLGKEAKVTARNHGAAYKHESDKAKEVRRILENDDPTS